MNNRTVLNGTCSRPNSTCSVGPFRLPVDGKNLSVTFCSFRHHHHHHHHHPPEESEESTESDSKVRH